MLYNKKEDNSINNTAAAALKYSRKAAIIAKIYINNQKYARVANSFNFKLTIFYNICKRLRVLLDNYIIIFLIMLKKLA